MIDPQNPDNVTPAALLEQLVYVDTFMPEIDDPSTLEERLTAELSAFADDSFVFPDEEKPQNSDDPKNDMMDRFNHINNTFTQPITRSNDVKQFSSLQSSSFGTGIPNVLSPLSSLQASSSQQLNSPSLQNSNNNNNADDTKDLLSNLPKVPVPPGAQSSLIAAGLSQTQIDALAALVAQHQGVPTSDNNINSNSNNISLDNGLGEFGNDEFLGNSVDPIVTTSNHSSVSNSENSLNFQNHNSSKTSIKIESSGDVDLDKRRRNTAASARFRIKKKLKEQELERTVRELNELTMTLEKKIQTLEMENKLLRNLVVEKGEQRNNEELENLKKRVRLESRSSSSNNVNFNGETSNF